MFGWYSQKQKDMEPKDLYYYTNISSNQRLTKSKCPRSNIYLDLNGNQVEVTMVSQDKNHGANTYYLDDIKYIGQVEKWVKSIY